MIVPQYWAEARLQHRARGKSVTVRRFGWSDDSVEAAQAHADARVREAMDRILAGDSLLRREHRVAYNGAEGLPIREEIVERHGEAIITRNGYGALCLNSPDVLFADIDFSDAPSATQIKAMLGVLALVAVAVGMWRQSFAVGAIALVAAFVFAYPLAKAIHRARVAVAGGHERRTRRRVCAFIARNRDWGVRMYRTPAGMRLLATHATFVPGDAEVDACFDAVGVDVIYARMCRLQHCFRARLTPKPWRVGMGRHIKPRYAVWDASHAELGERRKWIDDYRYAARGHAACRFVEALGNPTIHPQVAPVVEVHDALCRANERLPLA
jgi:hypothetical protein